MSKKFLFIVESQTKTKTLKNVLKNTNFEKAICIATIGHIMSIVPSLKSVNIDIEKQEVAIEKEPNKKTHNKFKEKLENSLKDVEKVFLATDLDREGEVIAQDAKKIIAEIKQVKFARIRFTEITTDAILTAIESANDINIDLIQEYKIRVSLDLIVGFIASVIAIKKLRGCRSIGRVQTAALGIIEEREVEIENYIPEDFYEINFNSKVSLPSFITVKKIISNIKDELTHFPSVIETDIQITYSGCLQESKLPPVPLNTAKMLIKSRGLGFSTSQANLLVKSLYEGVKIDNEETSLVSYYRTDATFLSQKFVKDVKEFAKTHFQVFENFEPRALRTRFAQEAHEAIRPTNVRLTPDCDTIKKYLNAKQLKLYTIIWQHAVGWSLGPFKGKKHKFIAKFFNAEKECQVEFFVNTSLHLGFKALEHHVQLKDEEMQEAKISRLIINFLKYAQLEIISKKTEGPARINEASLIKELQKYEIGRPSTYQYIVQKILKRTYVTQKKGTFTIKGTGKVLCLFCRKFLPWLIDKDFTKYMESELDKISKGESNGVQFLKDMKDKITKDSDEISSIPNITIAESIIPFFERRLGTCEKCNQNMVFKGSKFGYFSGCSNYPQCKNIKPF